MNNKTFECTIGECLKHSELFFGFTDDQLAKAAEFLRPQKKTYNKGDRVYQRGDIADRCWLILSGKLTVQRSSLRNPFSQQLYHLGSVTGIQGLAEVGSIRPVTLFANEKSELVEITYEGIDKFGADAQILLWKNTSRILLKKLFMCMAREEQ